MLHHSIRLPIGKISEEVGLSVQHVKKIIKEHSGKMLESKLH
jgi:DNA-binding Lrp family transcriptional regulator